MFVNWDGTAVSELPLAYSDSNTFVPYGTGKSTTSFPIAPNSTIQSGVSGGIAIGYDSNVSMSQGIAIGFNAQVGAGGIFAVALGSHASAGGSNSVALGYVANASAANSVSIGSRVNALYANSIQIGSNIRYSTDATSNTFAGITLGYNCSNVPNDKGIILLGCSNINAYGGTGISSVLIGAQSNITSSDIQGDCVSIFSGAQNTRKLVGVFTAADSDTGAVSLTCLKAFMRQLIIANPTLANVNWSNVYG